MSLVRTDSVCFWAGFLEDSAEEVPFLEGSLVVLFGDIVEATPGDDKRLHVVLDQFQDT